MALNTITLTGTYQDGSGTPLAGFLQFMPTAPLDDTTDEIVVRQKLVTATLSAEGTISAPLYAVDNANLAPSGWAWTVKEVITGLPPYIWSFNLDASPFSFTVTDASPAVFSAPGSAYADGAQLMLSNLTGAAPFAAGTTYFVVNAAGDTFGLAATSGGPAINSTSSGSGTVATASVDISTLEPLAVAPLTSYFMPQAGGDFTGPVSLFGNPTTALMAAPRQYVDAETTRAEAAETALGSELTSGLAAYIPLLTQTAVKTANYTAGGGQLVGCNISGGSFTVQLPDAPANGTMFGAEVLAVSGVGVNMLTLATQGSDVFDQAGGATTATMTLLHQALIYVYQSGVWCKVAGADPYQQVAISRHGEYLLDSYAGTDDQKLASALAAVQAAGGGTIRPSPRNHVFSNQLLTSFAASTAPVPIRILGAGSAGSGAATAAVTTSAGGITTFTCNYIGTTYGSGPGGGGQFDFQHNGLIEIAGIHFTDPNAGNSIPFIFCTNTTPYIHDNTFSGPAPTGASCCKDAIQLGSITDNGGSTSGDGAKYNGYNGWVKRNYFDTIRQQMIFGGGCNGVQYEGNWSNELCGMSGNYGAPIRFGGNSAHGNSGNVVRENYIPMGNSGTNYYSCVINALGSHAFYNKIGPNTIWDGSGTLAPYFVCDATCSDNFIDDTTWRTSNGTQANADLSVNSMNNFTSVISTQNKNILAGHNLEVINAPIIGRNQGLMSIMNEGYSGDRVGVQAIHNNTVTAPGVQFCAYPGTTVTDGNLVTGSNVVTSATAVFAAGDVGAYIHTPSTGIPSNTFIKAIAGSLEPNHQWVSGQNANLGDLLIPLNSHMYQCTTAGTAGSSQPTWPTSGGTVTDGSIVWQDLGTGITAAYMSQAGAATGTGQTVSFGRPGTLMAMTQIMNHHIIGSGGAPSWAPGSATIAGTGATCTLASNASDLGQVLTLTTGTGISAAGVIAVGTPANSFAGATKAGAFSVTPGNAAAATLMSTGGGVFGTFSANDWNLTANSQLTASTAYVFMINTLG